MNIAILTFDAFNEIDSFVSHHILTRVDIKAGTSRSPARRKRSRLRVASVLPRSSRSSLRMTPMRSCLAAVLAAVKSSRTTRSCRDSNWTRSVS